MSLIKVSIFECFYCMIINDIEVDEINDIGQSQVVDCQICCQFILVFIYDSNGEFDICVEMENE